MKIPTFLQRLNTLVDNWLNAPVANAAGRAGVFRILYALFYLWYMSANDAAILGDIPGSYYFILLVRIFPESMPPIIFQFLECLLVSALVILLIGFRVRFTTAVVLGTGCLLEAFYSCFDIESASVFLVFYIPFFMLLSESWGDTYSLDAVLAHRRTQTRVEPSHSAGRYYMASRCILVVLSVLFFGAAVSKVLGEGTWLRQPRYMADLVLEDNVKSSLLGLPLNPLAPFISENPLVYRALRDSVLLFEGAFFLALFHRKIRNFMLSLALVFHSVGGIWLVVTFTPVLIVYALFIDWPALLKRLNLRRISLLDHLPAPVLIGVTLGLAAAAGFFWNWGEALRAVFHAGGRINWHTIWYPVLPMALICCLAALVDMVGVTSKKIWGSRG